MEWMACCILWDFMVCLDGYFLNDSYAGEKLVFGGENEEFLRVE